MNDEELIEAYEQEFEPAAHPRSNRGFWIVFVTLLFGSVFVIVEIFANRPIATTIGHAQNSLRVAQAGAELRLAETGSFSGADAEGLASSGIGADEGLVFVGPQAGSAGLDSISVYASGSEWAAAVEARPGACFYLYLKAGEDVRYGVGTVCTAAEALKARDPRW